jgi:transposase-like protein
VRDTFGRFALIQRCQVHKGRNIVERLDPSLHAGVKKVLRDNPTAEQAERVLRNLARRLDHDAPGVSASIHEGLDEMLTVIRLGLPDPLRRALGCTNAIESLMAVLRQVCRNVKRWRNARMALRWTGTAMLEAKKTFHRLKAHKHLPVLRAALLRHQQAVLAEQAIDRQSQAA